MFRVGLGQDSHKFEKKKGKKLILGGVEIVGEFGLEGNSDADVIIHAVCRAIEQALGNDNFSFYSDKMCQRGITYSQEYLKVALKNMRNKKYKINNVGITVEAKKPIFIPWENKIKKNLASIMKIKEDAIGISATSGEGLTAFGKGLGIQVFAIISLVKI